MTDGQRRDHDHRARGRAGRARERAGKHAGRVRPRPVAAAEQLGPLGDAVRGGRATRALTPGWPDDPDTVEEANAHPEVFADKTVGQVADHFDDVIGELERKPADRRPLVRRPARADPRRPRAVGGDGRDRPGAVPRRAAAADLGAEVGVAGARQPGEPQPRGAAHLRAVPLRVRQRGERGRGEGALRRPTPCRRRARRCSRRRRRTSTRGPRSRSTAEEPRARPAAHHLRREGPHGAVGDRERVATSSRSATRA